MAFRFNLETAVKRKTLAHLGGPNSLPRLMPARGPPLWGRVDALVGQQVPRLQPAPEYVFDQRISR